MPLPVGSWAGSILVVEDEVILRMDLGDHLRSSGFTVLEAPNGDDALAVLKTEEGVRLRSHRHAYAGRNRWRCAGVVVATRKAPHKSHCRFRQPSR